MENCGVFLIHCVICVYQRFDEAGGWNWRESGSVHAFYGIISWLLDIGSHKGLASVSGLPIFTSCHIGMCWNSQRGKYPLHSRISVQAKSLQNFSKGFFATFHLWIYS
jgi:hypothetical protein